MRSPQVLRWALVCLSLLIALPRPASAQQRAQGTRAFIPSPHVLGMGGAAVAFPSHEAAFFYNPAHLAKLPRDKAPFTLIGFGASLSNNFSNQISFYNNELQPAIDQGIQTLEEDEEQALYDNVFRMGRSPTSLGGDILLPSFLMKRGLVGFGAGLFAHSSLSYRVEDAGAGVPGIHFATLGDVLGVVTAATDFSEQGATGLSAGMTGKYVQRYLMLKSKPLDAFDPDESLYVLGAKTLAFDLGLLYEVPAAALPGTLSFGLTASDLSPSDFSYSFSTYYAKNEEELNQAALDDEVAVANANYQLLSSFRLGVGYSVPKLAGPFKETGLALDYASRSDFIGEQPALARLSIGAQTMLGDKVALRAGLNQGYTTLGAGLNLPFMHLSYAYFGAEEGRLPGQSPSWHHRIQISLGAF